MSFRVFQKRAAAGAFAALALCAATVPSWAAPANTLKDMYGQLGGCLSREAGADAGASSTPSATCRFSIALVCLGLPTPAPAAPANTLKDMFGQLSVCLSAAAARAGPARK